MREKAGKKSCRKWADFFASEWFAWARSTGNVSEKSQSFPEKGDWSTFNSDKAKKKLQKQIAKIWTALEWIFLIFFMGQITLLGQDHRKKGKGTQRGKGVDIHKAIGKLPKPKKGWTLPGHNYTGPYNPLEQQLRYDPATGEILEYYVKPSGKTDAVAAQHDVDYSLCGNDRRCKNKADKKMVAALDAIPWKERQWGHALARNTINVKQKLGLGASGARGASRPKKGKRFWVKAGLKIWQTNYTSQSGGASQRGESFHMGLTTFWAADLVEMGKFSKWNKGIKYLLMVIDVFSKFGWIRPLKDKRGWLGRGKKTFLTLLSLVVVSGVI